ncbi:hypothetical protein DY000_02041325 [Brassica cretica]|uniref:BRCT domain-containing protein n=1 Tax=Brassica cretica TaxID=69181 RepID=A0ABQ7B5S7_BRACR|nr:hypothetical protein DY000_02041325 [Brassica cretica]
MKVAGPDLKDTTGSADTYGYRIIFRHPNTIAYPEKFFESAQAIAAHSHLRWPVLSREWIRRLQARIAKVDWESRLPCVLGPLDPLGPSDSGIDVTSEGGGASREEASGEGAFREEGLIATDQGGTAETSASGRKKKKKNNKRTKVGATDEVPPEESAPVNATLTDEVPPIDATSEGSKSKKKQDGRKRSRGGAEGQEAVLVGAASGGHPRKKAKRSVEAEPRPSTSDASVADAAIVDAVGEASGTPGNLSEEKRKTCSREGGSGGEPASSEPEGSVAKRRRVEFPDRVEFSYNETTPLILNPLSLLQTPPEVSGLRTIEADSEIACSCVDFIPKVAVRAFFGIGVNCRDTQTSLKSSSTGVSSFSSSDDKFCWESMTSMRLRLAGCSSSAEESASPLLFGASSSSSRC